MIDTTLYTIWKDASEGMRRFKGVSLQGETAMVVPTFVEPNMWREAGIIP
jgi:hypothetical protein